MSLGDYISGYIVRELNLPEDSVIAVKLKRIRIAIYFFLGLNAITCVYAFHILFSGWITALVAALAFQFIFLMIYIVLFATIRKSDFQEPVRNIKIKSVEQINNENYSASRFTTNLNNKRKFKLSGWFKIIFRSVLLIMMGIGPAIFFGIMVHHSLTNDKYEIYKVKFIDNQIYLHEKLLKASQQVKLGELDSMNKIRSTFLFKLDSLNKNPDPNGYYREDIAWYESRLKNFDELNLQKMQRIKSDLLSDSVASVEFLNMISNHFKDADFFQVRAAVTWENYPFTFFLISLSFVILLFFPFYSRYRLMIRNAPEMDDKLEKFYIDVISKSHENLLVEIRNTSAYKKLKNALNDNFYTKEQIEKFSKLYAYFDRIGGHYVDPAFKAKEKEDLRVFIDKGNLGRYLGK
ncbi:MAG: hypothetical protein ACK5AY_01065 [Bacteroidota bacterium]|jgi:hypothetical protein